MRHRNDSLKNERARSAFHFRLGENIGQFFIESDSSDKSHEIRTMLEFVLSNYLKEKNAT